MAHLDYKNGYYDGEVNYNNEEHGHGTFVWNNGDEYVGEWRNGEKHGHGVHYFSDGERYDGEWRDGKKHGHGIYYYSNGNKYDGEWRDGAKHGYGFMKYSNKTYDGYWESGDWKGNGKLIQNNGIEAEGLWSSSGNAKNVSCYINGTVKKGIIVDWNFKEDESEIINYTNKGSTAKIEPQNVIEELALKEVRGNPFTSDAKILKDVVMGDQRWLADDGWVKVERIVHITHLDGGRYDISIHYVGNIRTKEVDDFKIKYVKKTN